MTTNFTAWPDTTNQQSPPIGDTYRASLWLLGRHPRLAVLAARVDNVVFIDDADGELTIDLDHLSHILDLIPIYAQEWASYTDRHPLAERASEEDYLRWQEAGPRPGDFIRGMASILVMSPSERALLELLAMFGSYAVPFKITKLRSIDSVGQRIVDDWCKVLMIG